MKHLAAFFLLLATSAAFGQTVKTLGYNTTNGQVVYTGTNALYFTNPAVGFAKPPIFKVLTNDFSITNQTNMTVVDGLTVPTEAGKTYVFELFPIVSAIVSTTDVQIVASNATVYGFWDLPSSGSYSTNALTNILTFLGAAPRAIKQRFYVEAGTNAGSISLQFSSPNATNTNTIGVGSYMMAQEVTPTP